MAPTIFQKMCSQIEAEHKRVVQDLEDEIADLRQSLANCDSKSMQLAENTDSGENPPPNPRQVMHKSTTLEDAKLGLAVEVDPLDILDEKKFTIMALWPAWLNCCGVSAGCLTQWVAWWQQREEPERTGFVSSFVDSQAFQSFILLVIMCNTFWIISTTDDDMATALAGGVNCHMGGVTLIGEVVFGCIYIVELSLKLWVHKLYLFTHGDRKWNLFDAFLVITVCTNFGMDMLAGADCSETSSLTFLRTFRVLKSARVLRMLRVVRFIRELRLMLDCIVHSILHLIWCILLIGMLLLMFALYIMQGLKSHVANGGNGGDNLVVANRFNTVTNSMISLLMATTGGVDWSEQYDVVSNASDMLRAAYLAFICFFTMVAWNIVMSSFVEKANRLSMPDLEANAMEKYREQQTHVRELGKMLQTKLDMDGDGTLSLDEFKDHIHDEDLATFCLARDINITDVDMFFNMLAAQGTQSVDIKTFARSIVRLRGNASAIDMQSLHFDLKSMLDESRGNFCEIHEELSRLRKGNYKPARMFHL